MPVTLPPTSVKAGAMHSSPDGVSGDSKRFCTWPHLLEFPKYGQEPNFQHFSNLGQHVLPAPIKKVSAKLISHLARPLS